MKWESLLSWMGYVLIIYLHIYIYTHACVCCSVEQKQPHTTMWIKLGVDDNNPSLHQLYHRKEPSFPFSQTDRELMGKETNSPISLSSKVDVGAKDHGNLRYPPPRNKALIRPY